ncbi:MAG: TetR/AcrR family transcriptional regulator [Acidimicrobiia bacterium]
MKTATDRRAAHVEDTRAALLAAARVLFTEKGYAATGTEEIVQRASLTRGALYHHFRNKEDLFRAVLEQVEEELITDLVSARTEPVPAEFWVGFRQGCQRFLDACDDPAVRQIMLVDGPAVLGWAQCREIGLPSGFGALHQSLDEALKLGVLDPQPVEPLAHLLIAAISEAALYIAAADRPEAARAEMGGALDRLLERLRR